MASLILLLACSCENQKPQGSAHRSDTYVSARQPAFPNFFGRRFFVPASGVTDTIGISIDVDVSKRSKDGRADVLFSSPTRRNDIFLRTHSEAGTTIARIPVAFYEDNGAWSYRFEARLHSNTLDAFMVTDTEDPEVYHFEIAGTDGSTSQTSVEPQALTAPIVKVSPNFFAQLEQQSTLITDSPTQAELLTANGIEFPAGAGVFFGMLTGEFVMRNTDANHKKLSALIDKIETAGNPSGEKDEDDQAAATLESKP